MLIKYIDAAQNLSVQVHPDDAFARREEGDNGKTEMWYVIGAEEGAGIYCGFRKDTDKDAFLAKVQDGSVQELLNFIPVKAGDCFLIEAGTVHAIGAGCLICEVQQSSNVTYRVYDYGRLVNGKPRQLHLDKAMRVINFSAFRDRTGSGKKEPAGEGCALRHLTQCRYFRCPRTDARRNVRGAERRLVHCHRLPLRGRRDKRRTLPRGRQLLYPLRREV